MILNLKRSLSGNRGSVITEAAIALPLIFFIGFSAIEFGLTHYFSALLRNATAVAAQKTAEDLASVTVPMECADPTVVGGVPDIAINNVTAEITDKLPLTPATFNILVEDKLINSKFPFVEIEGSVPQYKLFCMFLRCNSNITVKSRARIENNTFQCI